MFLPIKYQRHTLAREKYYFSNTFYSSLFSISMSIITDLDLALNFFTNSSKEFLEALKSINDVIGIVPEKEAINTSMLLKKGIFDYLEETGQTHTQNKFIASLKKVFNQIETKGIE